MSTKMKQDILRFPVRKTRSTSRNVANKKLDFEESALAEETFTTDSNNEKKKFSRKTKNMANCDQENILSPTKKNCCLNAISPDKSDLIILNNAIPTLHLQKTPLKAIVSNSDKNSVEKTVNNTSLKKNDFQNGFSLLSNLGSPRRSPRKLNFDSPKRSSHKLNFDSPRRSPCKFNLDSPRRLPCKFDLDSPRRLPCKFDLDSPRRLPCKFDLDSPRRSPRKINFENSPSQLISKLSFSSPKAMGNTIGLHKVELKVYQALKASLTQTCNTEIVGRKTEINLLREFLDKHLKNCLPGSLYISGAPGTGKTALVSRIIKDFCDISYKLVTLNCMSKTSSKEIFSAIAEGLKININRTEREIIKHIEKSLTTSKVPVIIILDEVDQLESKDQKVLYTLFEWPALENSKLVLIGIANMLDLTDRILPRLQSVESCKPCLLHFPPYNKAEIIEIINDRIKRANIVDGVQVIKSTAIAFLAGKVSAVAGDVRKALDVCRRAVELCENQVKKKMRLVACKSPSKSPRKSTTSVLKQVDIPQVLVIFNEIYGSKVTNEITDNPNAFPLQQKVLICTLLLFLKHSKTKTVNLGQFHEVYSRVCIRQKLPSIEQSEFFSLCTLLEARGMLQVKKTKELRNSKIFLRLNEEETINALGDKVLLSNVLEDKASLNKTS